MERKSVIRSLNWLFASLAVCTSATALAALDCGPGRPSVTAEFGIDVTDTRLAPGFAYPGDLDLVQLAWLPADGSPGQQELVTVDWPARTASGVDLYDPAQGGIVATGIREAVVLPSTDWETGRLDIEFCPGQVGVHGLLFAYYDLDGPVLRSFVAPFAARHPHTWHATTVINAQTSEWVQGQFNQHAADQMRQDIEDVTGVLPPRYLAEHLYQRSIQAVTEPFETRHALAFDARGAVVIGNEIHVQRDGATVRVPHGVVEVLHDGSNILGPDGVLGPLEGLLGVLHFKLRPGDEVIAVHVLDARGQFSHALSACSGGTRTLNLNVSGDRLAPLVIRVKDPSQQVVASSWWFSLSAPLDCNAEYFVESGHQALAINPGHAFEWDVDISWCCFLESNPIPISTPNINPEIIRKVFGVDDLQTIAGVLPTIRCGPPGGPEIDTIDELAHRRATVLTRAEQDEFSPFPGDEEWQDTDGDGSICDEDEVRGFGEVMRTVDITIAAVAR